MSRLRQHCSRACVHMPCAHYARRSTALPAVLLLTGALAIRCRRRCIAFPTIAMRCAAAAAQPAQPKAADAAAVQRLRVLVANLKMGQAFCCRLAAALPQLHALLEGSAVNAVHDVICFLTLCK